MFICVICGPPLVVGILEAFRGNGSAIQLAHLSASICVICGFSWVGGRLCDVLVSSCLRGCDVGGWVGSVLSVSLWYFGRISWRVTPN